MTDLQGRVAVVTGAGRGIGREHALLLAASGARVVVNDLGGDRDGTGRASAAADEVVAEILAAGGEAVAHHDDVADERGAAGLVSTAVETFGRLDILVNNAGVLRDRVLVNLDAADFDIVVRVNLRGAFLPLREAARHWRARSKAGEDVAARVVNTSSESGVFANAGQANYAAAKSAVASLTQVASKELKRYGVHVNAILPRARTRMTSDVLGAAATAPREGGFDKWDPANVSPFVVFLSSREADFTGEVFLVGGSLVQRVRPWELDPDWILRTQEQWTPDELAKAAAEAGTPMKPRDTGNIS